ncbi:MAG: AmmeMemoRadiSam system radical SAM enzyme [Candidatus Heimdallarchaeaceae archaeon]
MKKLKLEDPRIKEAYLYRALENNRVQCTTCNRFCVIDEDDFGYCKTRQNIKGKLFTFQYSDISSYSLNPIEKKPAYHYYPTTTAVTLGSWGCNFPCQWCQNYEISKRGPPANFIQSSLLPVNKVLEVLKTNLAIQGVSFSFNEPTLFLEYIIDVFKVLDPDYYKHLVTNGYMSPSALDLVIDSGMDGMTVSFKGTAEAIDKQFEIETARIWRNIERAFTKGVHIEVVYLVIPELNDREEYFRDTARKIKDRLSEDTPLHFTKYFPHYLYQKPSTDIRTLQSAHDVAKDEGLNFVYLGNVPGHPLQNTYCPNCSELLMRRDSMAVTYTNLTHDNKCPSCDYPLPIYPYRKIRIKETEE